MLLKKRAEFLVVNKDNSSNKIVADNAVQAAAAFETEGNPVCQVSRDHEVNQYVEDPAVSFKTTVLTEAAAAAGCKAYPQGNWVKTKGDKVILSAVAASGYSFSSWTLAGSTISTSPEVEVELPSATQGTIVEYVANFVVA